MAIHKPNEPDKTVRPTEPPDPATSYERAKPEKEAGMGRLTNDPGTPADGPDHSQEAVANVQPPKGITAEDTTTQAESPRNLARDSKQRPMPPQPDHSMKEEEPLGWDEAPTDIHDTRFQRHPRKPGNNTGGTP